MPPPTALIKTLIPTMFHRRLVLLGSMIVVAFVALGVRVTWMTAVEGADARELAESRLVRWSWIPTVRGRIVDRNGAVLAIDQASYSVALDYSVLSGSWADRQGRRAARRANKDRWDLLDDVERDAITARFVELYTERVERGLTLLADRTATLRTDIEIDRGEIVRRVEAQHDQIVRARMNNEIERREVNGEVLSETMLEAIRAMADQPIREQRTAHTIVDRVDDAVAFDLMRFATRRLPMEFPADLVGPDVEMGSLGETDVIPGLKVVDATRREHPSSKSAFVLDRRYFPGPLRSNEPVRVVVEDIGASVIGSMRHEVYREDAQRRRGALDGDLELKELAIDPRGRDRGGYLEDDRVGNSGLEASLEHMLRGLRGVRTEDLQSGEVTEIDPVPGRDVQLTIDTALTGRIRAILDPRVGLTRVQPWHANEVLPVGTELDAAVLVLDVATGEIMAMVSTPTAPMDGDWSRLGLTDESSRSWFRRVRAPFVNRAVAKPYQPGSVAKALVLCGAAKLGDYAQGERIEATGHLYPDRPNMLRSWIYKDYGITHADQLGHDPDGVDALMVSSNVFFFTLGERLGPRGIRSVYELFRIGRGYDLGGIAVWEGSVGVFDGDGGTRPITDADAIQMGIGQGPVTWTPLHAADAYATIARGGYRLEPSLIRGRSSGAVERLDIPSWACRDALEGLRRVVSDPDYGTGHHVTFDGAREPTFNAPGLTVWGKTGTATASPLVVDPDDDGPQEPVVARSGDHSWYVSLVAPEGETPRYAVAVVVDYGGSGGRVSGPINNLVVHALIDEGYLPDLRPENTEAGR